MKVTKQTTSAKLFAANAHGPPRGPSRQWALNVLKNDSTSNRVINTTWLPF